MPRPADRPRRPRRSPKTTTGDVDQRQASQPDRLQKVLAAAGLGSRRQCEQLILAGRVEVDRRVVTELGTRADPQRQEIRVDGTLLPKRKRVYFLVHKPPGFLCTNRDPSGRQRVVDLVPPHDGLFTVGRLDKSSEGAILVTNDGDLANRLAHPRYAVAKTYQVDVAGQMASETLRDLRRGVHLAEAFVKMAEAHIKRRHKQSTTLEVVLREGRNREIRRMLAAMGHRVLRLRRIAMGPLRLGDLPAGAYRELSTRELRALRAATRPGGSTKEASPPRRRSGRKLTATKRAAARPTKRSVKKAGVKKKRPQDSRPPKRKKTGSRPGKHPARKPGEKRPAKKKGRR